MEDQPVIDNNSVRYYCVSCKEYISSSVFVKSHLEHEVIDLAERSTRYLAKYQRLSQLASMLADRRQIHIKNQSIQRIMTDIRDCVINAKTTLEKDINTSFDKNVKFLMENTMVQEIERVRAEISGKDDEILTKIKDELAEFCKNLLVEISENRYDNADKLIDTEKLKEYEVALNDLEKKAERDVEFIQELCKLKNTQVKYSYDPLAILGMIRVESQVAKPNRVMQFSRDESLVNIFYIEIKEIAKVGISVGFILPFRFITIEACNNVYFNGGDNGHNVYFKSHYLYDEFRGVLVPLSSMNVARSRHALACIPEFNRVYSIGGENENEIGRAHV